MKAPNNNESIILINKTLKKNTCNYRYSNLKNNNENKNIENIIQKNAQTNNKTLKKINPRLAIDISLNLQKN